MFNLVISIIAIALVVILASATIYFMGDSTSEQKIEAEAAKLRNEAIQISAAVKLYAGEGNEFGTDFQLQTLVDMGYLSKIPNTWEAGEDKIMYVLQDELKAENVCFVANRQAGYIYGENETGTVPYTKDPLFSIPICDDGLDALVPCCTDE